MDSQEAVDRVVWEAVASGVRLYQHQAPLDSYFADNVMGQCNLGPFGAAIAFQHWIKLVRWWLPHWVEFARREAPHVEIPAYVPVRFSDIEPYPLVPMKDHLTYIELVDSRLRGAGLPTLDTYVLDIDFPRVEKEGWDLGADFRTLVEFLKPRGIKVAVIINGENSTSPATDNEQWYFQTASRKLVRLKQLGIIDLVDTVIIQSWAQRSHGPEHKFGLTDMPVDLPDTKRNTHLNFLVYAEDCVRNRAECPIY
jgi:hypothetical protein